PVLFYINNTIIGYLNEASILKIEEEPRLSHLHARPEPLPRRVRYSGEDLTWDPALDASMGRGLWLIWKYSSWVSPIPCLG
ncbi:hypothetical protein, partial [Desulfosporosinus nitroreducens]